MPGAMFMMCCAAMWGAIIGMSWILRGNTRICESIMPVGDFGDEKWIFINGACTSYTQMMHHLTRLSIIFHRRVTGIHNRTLGLPLDLLLHLLSLEIYTFGAAGGSFSNPLLNSVCMELNALGENDNANMKTSCERVIPHIEHYLPLTSSPSPPCRSCIPSCIRWILASAEGCSS
ncbi:hypothetical protein EYC84_006809 [Monilinia fructicola]|uniref:Uncharacterized protein n=1 Tax=Monilinia fructicola TaxID=38448 RepID=A0A5M9K4K9_MONFR|nr:hypothetical protein EYC84_006809 [Monilinia fructicola]